MSAFIGPVHYWLYGKIKVVSEREKYIFHKADEMCGSTAEELRETVWQTYGAPLADTDLGDLIDHDNIHGWLHRQIQIAESREAAFIKELLDMCGAQTMIEQSFVEHGKITGELAKASGKQVTSDAPGIYQALGDYYLNGMPCDQSDMIVSSEEAKVVWEVSDCLQETNWKRAGVDLAVMMNLYQKWIQAFVEEVNAGYSFRQVKQWDESVTRYEIYKVS
jgi:hypothetical protein